MKVQGNCSHGCEHKLHGRIHAVPGIFMAQAFTKCHSGTAYFFTRLPFFEAHKMCLFHALGSGFPVGIRAQAAFSAFEHAAGFRITLEVITEPV